MGRAPNSGAPQRVSAHVVPKAPSFSAEDEDDKTTIESGWEEEASTTVEQGEVAERLRALAVGEAKRRSGTNITSTDGGELPDEPTVDDQRANAALAKLPPPAVAKLVITAGNDAGQALEVRPGKTYTIGRGVDNDLVLTDIAVSRKHFDVRHDNGAWVLADRGSGNGTLVNTRIEDAPFMLASGDVIEIGNTAFRFDLPNGAPRPPVSDAPSEGDDDLEMSTVSGKPFRELESTTPPESASPVRPKTLPAPVVPPSLPPPRARSLTARPPTAGYAIDRPGARISQSIAAQQTQPPIPVSALGPVAPALLPMPPLAPLSPLSAIPGPHTLHLPQPSTTMPLPQMANRPPLGGLSPSGLLDASAGALPATIPGGQAAPIPSRGPRLPFSSYPPGTAEIPTQRAPTSTRQPIPQAIPLQPSQPLQQSQPIPQPSREQMTAQVVPIPHANGQPARMPPPGYGPPPPISRQAKMVLAGVGLAVFAAVATIAIIKGARGAVEPAPPQTAPAAPPPKPVVVAPKPVKPAAAPVAPTTTPPSTAPTPPVTATRVAPATTPTPPPATPPPATPPPTAPTTATTAQAITTPPVTTPPVATPPTTPHVVAAPPPTVKKPDKKPEKKPDKKPEVAIVETSERPDPAPRPDKKRGRTTQDVKNDASGLYRAKNFSGAAALITAALPSFTGGEAQDLRSIAAIYSQLGKSYNIGIAPGTKPTEAYQALRRAASYDRDVGSAYVNELQEKLVGVASRAAVSYMASKEFEAAFQAVRTAESLGSSSSSNKAVRDRLEVLAGENYRSAQTDLASDPEGAKKKLRQILGIVDPKNPLYSKAQKLLNAP